VVVVARVWAAQGIVPDWELTADVEAPFEVGEAFMKAPAFHMVFNS